MGNYYFISYLFIYLFWFNGSRLARYDEKSNTNFWVYVIVISIDAA